MILKSPFKLKDKLLFLASVNNCRKTSIGSFFEKAASQKLAAFQKALSHKIA
jgi:hypothetical protein